MGQLLEGILIFLELFLEVTFRMFTFFRTIEQMIMSLNFRDFKKI